MATVLPAYVVIDESAAMRPCGTELAEGLIALCDRLRAEPMTAARLRLTVLGMADSTRARLPLSDPRTVGIIQQPVIGGRASYAPAFGDLLARIPADVAALKAEGHRVQRPAVFFLAGSPPDPGPAAPERQLRRQLTDRAVTSAAPEIVTCVLGDAIAAGGAASATGGAAGIAAAREIATRPEFAFATVPGAPAGAAVTAFFDTLAENLIASGRLLGSAAPQLVVTAPAHFSAAPPAFAPAPASFAAGNPGYATVSPPPGPAAAVFGGAAAAGASRLHRLRRALPATPRHRRTLVSLAATAAAIALVAGLVTSLLLPPGKPSPPPAALSAPQFEAALDALVYSPGLHYRTTTGDGEGQADLWVNASGDLVGTISQSGQDFQLLQLDGSFYLKAPSAAFGAKPGTAEAGILGSHWLTGRTAASTVGWNASAYPSPAGLASRLANALGDSPAYDPHLDIGGTPVLAANTSLGTLYVASQAPYRVVELVPAASSGGASTAGAVTGGRQATLAAERSGGFSGARIPSLADAGPASAVSYLPESSGDVANTDKDLTADAGQLSTAVNADLTASMQEDVHPSCSEGGCSAAGTETITAESSSGTVTGGSANVTMTANFTVEGEAAGSCQGNATIPVNGSGQISCADPGAGAVFAAADARLKAQAEAAGAASGQTSTSYVIHYAVDGYVYATIAANVSELVQAAEGDTSTDQGLLSQEPGPEPDEAPEACAVAYVSGRPASGTRLTALDGRPRRRGGGSNNRGGSGNRGGGGRSSKDCPDEAAQARLDALKAAIRGWPTKTYKVGNLQLTLPYRRISHILSSHMRKYWDGKLGSRQNLNFFDDSMSISDILDGIDSVLQQNKSRVEEIGKDGFNTVEGEYKGKMYQVGLDHGEIGRFTPLGRKIF